MSNRLCRVSLVVVALICARGASAQSPAMDGIRTVSDPALAADIQAFTSEHPVPQAKQTLQQHLERMRVSVALREREADRLATALR